ncbi:hypothetical protein EXIGLDRAFT_790490 [Exidia glandulosa HHB12029]|uniref:Uncharacterized protein n=1 Tax=Exidia glandulosa HHB12029 TaxID=1314781 RepID=A0A166MIC4_EXIGL|nr:hypothetical protein EXIGLDRAFT_790490 [Exidia glandulosa HHB12029]
MVLDPLRVLTISQLHRLRLYDRLCYTIFRPWFAGYRLILFILGLSATSGAAGGGIFACIKSRRRRKQQEAEAVALSGQPQNDVEKGSLTSTSDQAENSRKPRLCTKQTPEWTLRCRSSVTGLLHDCDSCDLNTDVIVVFARTYPYHVLAPMNPPVSLSMIITRAGTAFDLY